ncbi:hypothetical protein SFRURICE_002660, partial [Spodoptera frugiperda]
MTYKGGTLIFPLWKRLTFKRLILTKSGFRNLNVFFKDLSIDTHHGYTQNNNLWITQRVVPCGNRTPYALYGSRLPGCFRFHPKFSSHEYFIPFSTQILIRVLPTIIIIVVFSVFYLKYI